MKEIMVPFGVRSWRLPQYKGRKISTLGADVLSIPDRVEIDYCEIRRGDYVREGNRSDFPHPLNNNITVHFCPYHDVRLIWCPPT